MKNLIEYHEFLNEGLFKKVKDFFKEKPREDDEFGEKIINYINNNDIEIEKRGGEGYNKTIYSFVIRKNFNEVDPLGEEVWENDLQIKIIENHSFETYYVNVYVNEDELELNRKIEYLLSEILEKKYKENLVKERKNRINKYKELI
jgi:hypothetical protein